MEEKSIESSRGRIFYWTQKAAAGDENLVFLPGLTADHRLFDLQLSYFAKSYNVLVWDAPAHGKSRPYRDFSYAHLAEELKAILDAEGFERVILVGQSAGGFVAQSFIARYPSMVRGLFTIGTCPYGTAYYSGSDRFWLRQTKWMFQCFPDRLLRSSIAKMCSVTPAGRVNMLRMLGSYDKKELCRLLYLGFAGFLPEIQNLSIPCPVCLTVGEKDRTGKVRTYNERWHEKEGVPLQLIKGASHNANYDQPDEMNRLLEAFIQSLSTR